MVGRGARKENAAGASAEFGPPNGNGPFGDNCIHTIVYGRFKVSITNVCFPREARYIGQKDTTTKIPKNKVERQHLHMEYPEVGSG